MNSKLVAKDTTMAHFLKFIDIINMDANMKGHCVVFGSVYIYSTELNPIKQF